MRLGWMIFATVAALTAQRVQFVEVEPGVKLEVLDWGGSGRPVILLAGYLTGHSFEPLARELIGSHRVFSLTRRGIGASSQPEHGYSTNESAADVAKVIQALGLKMKPIVAGHSFGGYDLNALGVRHAELIAGLVYLNSAEDPKLRLEDYGVPLPAKKLSLPPPVVEPEDRSSVGAYLAWQQRVHGIRFPEAEMKQLFAVNQDGSLGEYLVRKSFRDALFRGIERPEYARIRVPVLAFFAGSVPVEAQLAKAKPATDEQREAVAQKAAFDEVIRKRHIDDLRRGVPTAEIVEIPRANFYIFLSHPREIAVAMRRFAARL